MRIKAMSRRAFTLIELLVVVSIIALLASLLLPGLTKAKQRTQAIGCMNNVKQLQLASLLYAGDNSDYLPPNYPDAFLPERPNPSWVVGYMIYEAFGIYNNPGQSTNVNNLLTNRTGSIGPYSRSALIYKCPGDRSYVEVSSQKLPRVRSYAVNMFVDGLASQSGSNQGGIEYRAYRRTHDLGVPPPSETFTFLEQHEDSIIDCSFGVGMDYVGTQVWWIDLPSTRHGKSSVIAFADGHARQKKWVDARTIRPVTRTLFIGEKSPNNPDVAWIQEHATARIDQNP